MRQHLLLFVLLFSANAFAQIPETELPHFATPLEQASMLDARPVLPTSALSDPPALPVRAMAEWEELQALVITWRAHPAILTEIVRAAREECRVIILCNNASTITSAQNTLVAAGVDITSNVAFLLAPNDSIWVRDYGPNCVYANDVDSLYFVDWRYNRTTRRRDDTVSTTLGPYLGAPLYTTSVAPNDLVHTGGNFMSDGMGTAFSSDLILEENQAGNPYGASVKNREQIEGILRNYMGVNRYILMEKLPFDVIHHIDMHMKLLDEQTLLVGEYPPGTADGPQIEANIQYVLANHPSSFGSPYEVVRVPMPPDALGEYPNTGGDYRTYANAIFVNKTVLVPFYEEKYDTIARRIWQEALPGYRIVGIDCNAIIPSLGAIHCITKEVGAADPLRIVHRPLSDVLQTPLNPSGYPVFATLQHRSGIQSARVWYTLDTAAAWQFVDMVPVPSDSLNLWVAEIPRQNVVSTQPVFYYIEANAFSGKSQVRPLPAPRGWWRFNIEASPVSNAPEPAGAGLLTVFPNPASAMTCVPVTCTSSTRGHVGLFDALGREVIALHGGDIPTGTSRYFFDAGALPAGVYWVRLQAGGAVMSQMVVVR